MRIHARCHLPLWPHAAALDVYSVCWHYVSEISQRYFSGAIMESGTCASSIFFQTLYRARNFSQPVVKFVGCDGAPDLLACLRKQRVEEFFLPPSAWPADGPERPPMASLMSYG